MMLLGWVCKVLLNAVITQPLTVNQTDLCHFKLNHIHGFFLILDTRINGSLSVSLSRRYTRDLQLIKRHLEIN